MLDAVNYLNVFVCGSSLYPKHQILLTVEIIVRNSYCRSNEGVKHIEESSLLHLNNV